MYTPGIRMTTPDHDHDHETGGRREDVTYPQSRSQRFLAGLGIHMGKPEKLQICGRARL